MIVEQSFECAASGLGLCERGQSRLNVLSNGLPSLFPGLIKRQVFDRTQGSTLTVRPGHDPCLMPGGLHAKNQTTNLSVPELIGAILGFSRENDAFGEDG